MSQRMIVIKIANATDYVDVEQQKKNEINKNI